MVILAGTSSLCTVTLLASLFVNNKPIFFISEWLKFVDYTSPRVPFINVTRQNLEMAVSYLCSIVTLFFRHIDMKTKNGFYNSASICYGEMNSISQPFNRKLTILTADVFTVYPQFCLTSFNALHICNDHELSPQKFYRQVLSHSLEDGAIK